MPPLLIRLMSSATQSGNSRRIGNSSFRSNNGLRYFVAVYATAVFVGLLPDPACAQDASPSPTRNNQPESSQLTPRGCRHGPDPTTGRYHPANLAELGVTGYTAGQSQIASAPGGASAPFQQVLLRLPGVVQDSYGEIHVRGEHGYAEYRINGVMLPEGLEGFGQEFDSHFIQSATLLTGALPAQFGLRLYGVVDITTKTGSDLNGGEAGVYAGSFDTVRPYIDYGGSDGNWITFSALANFTATSALKTPLRAREHYTITLIS